MTEQKYSICLDSCCPKKDTLKAMQEVKAAGFKAIEFWSWSSMDLQDLKKKADDLGLSCTCFGGTRKAPCTLAEPKDFDAWIEGLKKTVDAAKLMGNKCFTATIGDDTGARRDFQRKAIVKALKAAAPILMENNLVLNVEPLNGRINHIGTFLESSDEAFEILDEVGCPNIKLLFDIYHQQISEGDIIHRMLPRIKQIGHVHAAGSDGRHELDLGELNYHYIIKALADAGYDAYIGLEYFPIGDSLTGLKRMYEYLHN